MSSVKRKRSQTRRYDNPIEAIRDCLTALEPLRNFARLLVTRTPHATRHVIEESEIAEAKSATKRLAEIVPAVGEAVKRIESELIYEPMSEPTGKRIFDFGYLGKGGRAYERKSNLVYARTTAESAFHLVLKIARIYLEAFAPFAGLNLRQERWRERWGEQWKEKRLYFKLCELPEFDADWLFAKCREQRGKGRSGGQAENGKPIRKRQRKAGPGRTKIENGDATRIWKAYKSGKNKDHYEIARLLDIPKKKVTQVIERMQKRERRAKNKQTI